MQLAAVDDLFKPSGYFAPQKGVDRVEFLEQQNCDIELGLFRMIFWGGEKPENIKIASYEYRGLTFYYFIVRGKMFWPPREERMVI